ncbi:MAG: hypothetical protein QOG96_530, partial [Pseudonocardiales bacterium]|nr:hypothetical protein [Pseudonocardiales bacterium]
QLNVPYGVDRPVRGNVNRTPSPVVSRSSRAQRPGSDPKMSPDRVTAKWGGVTEHT